MDMADGIFICSDESDTVNEWIVVNVVSNDHQVERFQRAMPITCGCATTGFNNGTCNLPQVSHEIFTRDVAMLVRGSRFSLVTRSTDVYTCGITIHHYWGMVQYGVCKA